MPGPYAGRRSHRWKQLTQAIRNSRAPCGICGQAIDYRLAWPDPDSFSVDHIVPLSHAPHLAEEPSNLRAAHLRCNQSKADDLDDPEDRLGTPSRNW
jgi:5-methylcytosine-specific restriction endonuclease McrA